LSQPLRDRQAPVAADDDEGIDAPTRECPESGIRPVDMRSTRRTLHGDAKGIITVGRAKDRPTLSQNAGHVIASEGPYLICEEPGEAIQEARHLETVAIDGRLDDGTEGRVHPWTIAARRHDTYVPQWSHDRSPSFPRA
jgi:hypothetical protein